MNHQEIYNQSDKDIRLDVFLLNYLKNISRTKIQKLINEGFIKVDDCIEVDTTELTITNQVEYLYSIIENRDK